MRVLRSLLLILVPFYLSADVDLRQYELMSQQALEMSQYHPDKARKMQEELALKLEGEVDQMNVVPSHLAYNLGNLWYHAGDLGRSMLWYRRSELQTPRSEMLRHNLDIVMAERLDELPQNFRPKWFPYVDELVLLEPVFFWLFYIFSVYLLWNVGRNIRAIPESLKVKLVTCFLFGALWLGVYALSMQRGDGVITDAEIVARKGNGLVFAPAFTYPLHEGTEVIKLEERANWVYVQLSNGQRCWLPERSVGWVR